MAIFISPFLNAASISCELKMLFSILKFLLASIFPIISCDAMSFAKSAITIFEFFISLVRAKPKSRI